MGDRDEEKKTERNLTACSSKSEEQVTNNKRRARRSVQLKLINDSYEALRGLSATAELLVLHLVIHCVHISG